MDDQRTAPDRSAERAYSPDDDHGLEQLDVPELRARRRAAEAEESELSYVRRLLQGRIDILRAEVRRRAGHGDAVLPSLPNILSDGPRGLSGPGRHVSLTIPDSASMPHRADQLAAANAGGSDLSRLTDRELRGILDTLQQHERSISDARGRVHRVLDHLGKELTTRYRDGSAQVDDLLASVRRR